MVVAMITDEAEYVTVTIDTLVKCCHGNMLYNNNILNMSQA